SFFGSLFDQFGSLLAIDVSNPGAPTLAGPLFNNRGSPDGGDTFQNGAVIVNSHLAYVASSTSTGSSTQTGGGRVLVVDDSNPTQLSVLREVDIPGTVQVVDVAIQGKRALVAGSTGGESGSVGLSLENAGLTGNLTLTVLDITDPQNPAILGNTLVTDGRFA